MLNIATMNIQNKYKIKKYDGLLGQEDHIEMLFELIKKYHINIVGLQEVNPRYYRRLEKRITPPYVCYGNTRYQENIVTNHIGVLETFNERVPIITDQKVLSHKTEYLPWLSSLVPRIVTMTKLATEQGEIVVFNTHLDHRKNKTKVKELKYLLKMIKEISHPVILMGDFNMTTKNKDFVLFTKELKNLKINHIDIKEKTYKEATTNYAIDHVFLSERFKVESVLLEKDKKYQSFSDHYPIILKLHLGFSKK